MGLLLFFLFLSIAFSFLCSVLEAVLLSVTPAYAERSLAEGGLTGQLLKEYKEDIDRPLSAILTLNTIAHTVGAIGVGAQAGALYSESPPLFGILNVESLIAGLMTLAILILSEIIPKTIGANNWQQLTPFTVRTLRIMLISLMPLVWLSQQITKTLKKDKKRSVLSRADFAAMTHIGEKSGALDKSESIIIKNLLEFEKLTVRDIMTPKTVLVMANKDTALKAFYNEHHPIRYSRIPIFGKSRDQISGFFLKADLLQNLVEGKDEMKVTELQREVKFVEDDMGLPALFELLTTERWHLAVVTDDYGSVVGLVTMEDLLETLLGLEIVDEFDSVEDLQRFARKKWEERRKGLNR